MRTIKTIAIVIGMYAAAMVMELVMASSSPDYEGGISAIVILAILGFVLAAKKTRALAIVYCILGLLTIICAAVVGSIQISSYQTITQGIILPVNVCYFSTLVVYSVLSLSVEVLILPIFSGLVLLVAAFLLIFSWAGSLVYISKVEDNSVQPFEHIEMNSV
jgi:hypothetical protein